MQEAELSLVHRIRTLTAFKAKFHIHLSSVDVYDNLADPSSTAENAIIDISKCSHYGAHKLLAEALVKPYAPNWLIFRLSGMVGQGLRKNPVYDIRHGGKIFIHPQSRYQYCNTYDVATAIWEIYEKGISTEIFNIAGRGTISPSEIHSIHNAENSSELQYDGVELPRIVEVDTSKVEKIVKMQESGKAISDYFITEQL